MASTSTTFAVTPIADTTTTPTTTTTTTTNPWPLLGDELAQRLGCTGLVQAEHRLVETDWTLECVGGKAPGVLVLLFESKLQRSRYLSYFQVGHLILGPGWAVAADELAGSVDEMALLIEGVVVVRATPPYASTDPVPPVGVSLSAQEAEDVLDEALLIANSGDPMSALPLLNRVVASRDLTGEVAVPRSAALLNRGLAYENLAADPPGEISHHLVGEAALSYQWLVDEYAESDDDAVHHAVTWGLSKYGLLSGYAGEYDAAVQLFDEAIQRGIASGNTEEDFWVAESMFFRALALVDSGDLERALTGLEQLITLFENPQDTNIQPIIDDARHALDCLPDC